MFASHLDTRQPEHLTIRTRTVRNPERYDLGVFDNRRRPRSARRGRKR